MQWGAEADAKVSLEIPINALTHNESSLALDDC